MSYLPLYIDTSGKKCLIIGGGKVASRKLVPILKSKMHVTMISPEIHNEILEFVKDKDNFEYHSRDTRTGGAIAPSTFSSSIRIPLIFLASLIYDSTTNFPYLPAPLS